MSRLVVLLILAAFAVAGCGGLSGVDVAGTLYLYDDDADSLN